MPIIPVHDGRALTYIGRPYVAWGLMLANVLVYLVVEGGGFETEASQASVLSFGLIPAVFNNLAELPPDLAEIPGGLTLITYAFLHGNLWHLIGNMVFLWVFADNVEDSMGHVRFLAFYCLCAIGGGYAYVLSNPATEAPVVGASGAVAGVVAAYFILHPFQKIWVLALGRIPLRLSAVWVLGFWILYQGYAVLAADPEEPVAWWSHIGGLLTGALLVLVMRRRGVPLFDRGIAVLPASPRLPDIDGGNTPR